MLLTDRLVLAVEPAVDSDDDAFSVDAGSIASGVDIEYSMDEEVMDFAGSDSEPEPAAQTMPRAFSRGAASPEPVSSPGVCFGHSM